MDRLAITEIDNTLINEGDQLALTADFVALDETLSGSTASLLPVAGPLVPVTTPVAIVTSQPHIESWAEPEVHETLSDVEDDDLDHVRVV